MVRLQKKVMELESRCSELEKELKDYGIGSGAATFNRKGVSQSNR